MTYKEYLDTLTPLSKEIILLEGTRKLMDADAPKLTALAQQLAAQYPNSIFRTGNATGSDEAFAKGISQVDATRLEYVLPSSGMGKKRLIPNARVISLEDLSKEELNHLVGKTLEATPNYQYLVDCYLKGIKNRHAESAKLLIRDVLKVYGSKANGFLPATAAIFYVNFENPKGGGTGHTVRACVQRKIPFFTQMQWMEV
jgi:hypothetical protein